MKPTREQLARGLKAALNLKDNGPGDGRFPVSFTKNPTLYVETIAEAVLADVPEPESDVAWDFGCECGYGCPAGEGCRG